MPDLFGDKQGSLVTLSTDGFPAVITLDGITGAGSILVTSVGFGQGANVQFMHTLRNVIYIYAFGERMGSVKVSGLLVFRDCSNSGQRPIHKILQYYKDNTVSEKEEAISVSIGGEVLRGFLISVEFGGDNQLMGIARFSLTFASLPAGE